MRDAGPWQRLRWLQIVVAYDEVLFGTGQLVEELPQPFGVLGFRPVGEVTNDPECILGADHGPEVLHQNRIHVVR